MGTRRNHQLPRAITLTVVGALVAATTSGAAASTRAARPTTATATATAARERVVVTFADDAGRGAALQGAHVGTQAQALHATADATALGGRVAVLELTPAEQAALADEAGVVDVEPDVVVRADRTPTDPAWSLQSGARQIDADDAWDLTTGDAEVVVAVIDTGIDGEAADVAGRVTPGYDFVNTDSDPADDNGHGTAVASIIGAASNTKGIAGICWTCRIMPVKTLGDDGAGYLSDAALGISWAVEHGADVINLSLGAPSTSTALQAALQQATDAGVVVVASAGNDGTTAKQWPAADARAIGVAALDGATRADYSNHGSWVDIAAPGCNPAADDDGTVTEFCGTSSSAPLVSGVAALVRAGAPAATLTDQLAALTDTATPLASGLGAGRVDADAAIIAAADADPADGPTPVPAFTDIAESVHRQAIETLAATGITAGCAVAAYCPDGRVNRGQIATFMDRGLALPDGEETFADVPADHPHAAAIAAVARAGITQGCATNRYCPGARVTRGQMATLLARALDLPTGTPTFADVPAGHPHAAGIAAVARAGITKGCATNRYCPDKAVDRAQMASFLVRALDL